MVRRLLKSRYSRMCQLIVVSGVLAAFAVALRLGTAAAARFREEEAIHIEPASVENGTLAIGTHLIYLHSMNDEIYAIALESASESGQDKWYYKSELAGGMWIDITDAGSIKDVTAAGKTVEDREIRELFFTHHTKSDGITYSLQTNQPVCIFEIQAVYEQEKMKELEALQMQYELMRESNSTTATAVRNRALVADFFSAQVRSDKTDQIDAQLRALQWYYNALAAEGADSRALDPVLAVMEKLDNARRAEVFTVLDRRLSALQDSVADVRGKNGALEIDDALLTAIGDSQYALAESLTAAQGNMLEKGSTVLSGKRYELETELIANAEGADRAGCDISDQKLQWLDNISSGRIVSRQDELGLLDELIDAADVAYGVRLSGGVTIQYTVLAEQDASRAALADRMQADMADTGAAQGELQFLVQAKADRLEGAEAADFVLMRIQDAAKFRAAIKSDEYRQGYQDSVAAYVEWLNRLLSNIRKDSASQSREETLYDQKAALQEQKLQALDVLDLDTAKRIDAKIADIDAKIGASEGDSSERLEELLQKKTDLEAQLAEDLENAVLQAQLSRLEVEIADCRTGLPQDSQAANIMACKSEILRLLAGGDTSDAAMDLLDSDLGVLMSMLEDGSALALEASKEVYQKLTAKSELEGVTAYRDLQEQMENAIVGSDVRTGLDGELSEKEAEALIADVLGVDALFDESGNLTAALASPGGLSKVQQEDLAAALIALGAFGTETGAGSIQALIQGLSAALYQTETSGVFRSKRSGGESYVPARLLAEYGGYRYVWSDADHTAVLSKGRQFYRFRWYDSDVEDETGTLLSMKNPAGFSDGLWIPCSFAEEQFACTVRDIDGTDYAVLVSSEVAAEAQSLLSELQEGLAAGGGYGWE